MNIATTTNPAPPTQTLTAPLVAAPVLTASGPEQNFRFYDNRQKYLMFVNTCSEKRVVAERVVHELGSVHPRPPAVRLFDAGDRASAEHSQGLWFNDEYVVIARRRDD
jgi:hypothetical protein